MNDCARGSPPCGSADQRGAFQVIWIYLDSQKTQPLTKAKMNPETMIITPVTTAITRAYQRRMSSLLSDDIEKL